MKPIVLPSGFGRGARLYRLEAEKLVSVASAAENTWCDDGDDTKTVSPQTGKTYVLGTYRVDGHTCVWSYSLVGDTVPDLSAPAPVAGWSIDTLGCRVWKSMRVTTLGDWLACAGRVTPDAEVLGAGKVSPNGEILVALPYCWGDQASAQWAVYAGGRVTSQAVGCGDRTPIPFLSPEGGWDFTSREEDREEDRHAEERAEKDAELARVARSAHRRELRATYVVAPRPGLVSLGDALARAL